MKCFHHLQTCEVQLCQSEPVKQCTKGILAYGNNALYKDLNAVKKREPLCPPDFRLFMHLCYRQ